MARSLRKVSAAAAPEFTRPVQFLHPKTGRRYRVFQKEKDFFIEEFFLDAEGRIVYSDLRRIDYVIGSGNHARSFLAQRSGRLYQAPVTYYTQIGSWDMSPGYDTASYVGFTRKVTANCLFCHAGRINVAVPAQDRFNPKDPFAELSIGCERCHGPGQRHVAEPGKAIVNPAKLESARRDQVCEQCHLFGASRVIQPAASLAGYHPGKRLEQFVAAYGYGSEATGAPTVTGHSEEMKSSACRRRSGGKLWCGSCHEVHGVVDQADRTEFYRRRCLNCHTLETCSRQPEAGNETHRRNDCVACHMPKRSVVESAHVTFTDHRIPRRPDPNSRQDPETTALKLLLPPASDDKNLAARNLGFAYADLASSAGRAEFASLAVQTLQPLADTKLADAEYWENLAGARLMLKQISEAEAALRRAIEENPRSASAHYSLGFVKQFQGDLPGAIKLYQRALKLDPRKSEALGNLAAAHLKLGNRAEAARNLALALELEPGNLIWRSVLASLREDEK